MYEHVGFVGGDGQGIARRRVARDHDLAALAIGAHHLVGRHAPDRFAALQTAEVGPRADAELLGDLGVQVAGTSVLDQHVPVGGGPFVVDRDRGDPVPLALNCLSGAQLDEGELERQAAERRLHARDQLAEAGRAVDGEGLGALTQRQGLEHAGEAEPVVGVEVREVDGVEIEQPDRAQELALRAFAAVEQQLLAASAHEQRGQAAARARRRAGRAGEEDREVHQGYGTGAAGRQAAARLTGAGLGPLPGKLVPTASARRPQRP